MEYIRKKLCVLLAAVFAVAAAVFVLLRTAETVREAAAEITIIGSDIGDSYTVGDTFTMPSGVRLSDGENSYEASAVLKSPSGNGYSQESVVLSEAGKYSVEYRATDESGNLLAASESFLCSDALYGVSSTRSTASYETIDTYTPGVGGLAAVEVGQSGVHAALSSGDTLSFNQPIDLSDLTADSTLIDFFVLPETMCTADATQIDIVLTDLYDPSNTVTISVKKVEAKEAGAVWAERYSYIAAGASSQLSTGLESDSDGTFQYEGGRYNLHQGNSYGAAVTFSLPGGWLDNSTQEYTVRVGQESLRLSYDSETKRIYANNTFVVDLDDSQIFGANVWSGFSSDQVLLSMKCSSYNTTLANIVVTDVCGMDLSENAFSDVTAPVITVDAEDPDNMPPAKTNTAYPVNSATAVDNLDGETEVNVHVWYNYGTQQAVLVRSDDGCFTPTLEGVYTIEYTSSDKEGNTARVALSVTASSDLQPLDIQLSDAEVSGTAGQAFTIAEPSFAGGSGTVTWSARAVLASDPSVVYEIGEDLTFVPLYEGLYTIEYEAADYIFTDTASYSVTIAPATGPYIEDDIVLPAYFIAGAKYELPEKYGYTFENGEPVEMLCSISVSSGTIDEDNIFTVTSATSVTITYSLDEEEIYRTIPVIGVGYGETDGGFMPQNYFIHDGFTAVVNNSDIQYTISGSSSYVEDGSASLSFINAIQAKDLLLQFTVGAEESGYEQLTIWLTDSENSDIALKLTFINTGGSSNFLLNDTDLYTGLSSVFGSTSSGFSVSYTESSNLLNYTSSLGVYPQYDYYGNAFNGFPSGKVYLTFELEGIDGSSVAGIRIGTINNQGFGTSLAEEGDLRAPEVIFTRITGERTVGDTVTLPAAFAADVLDPYVDCTLTVYYNNQPVSDVNGLLLQNVDPTVEYTILLSEFGSYRIAYTVSDGNGNTLTSGHQYVINVNDVQPPEVVIGSYSSNVSVGSSVTAAEVTLSDDNTDPAEIILRIYLYAPDGTVTNITESGSFTAETSGIYKVYYHATDAAGNVNIVGYSITAA